MALFGKKRDEIIDYSEMYKRGMIKAPVREASNEVIDFTKNVQPSSSPSTVSNGSSNDNFDFLGGLAGAGASFQNTESGSVSDSLRAARMANRDGVKTEVNELKIKLDDTNYKLENLIDKVRELESKLREMRF